MRPGRAAERGALLLGGLASLTLAGGLLGILVAAVWWGWPRLSLGLLTRAPEHGMTAGGILPAVAGTLILIGLMLVVVVPVGTLAGIYLHEYAPARSRVTRAVLLALEGLAGVPPVIVGLFGFGFFVQYVGGRIDRWLFGGEVTYRTPSLLWAALTLAVLTLPPWC
ncbi:ABC transporter permease family protein [Caldinitratiruptor microaerophilus]|uniref:Uncharacterized protein n=1 Tax=Caldinitratiruptor microaerophilus TaxID=671077 RepID=A0AA35G8R2_9FIRM|nr:hypothetical protein [Caldinitratiruptor microaerophilus]BDG60708.1 hypothetical protein caldi_17980 [Caldinitratiruptor microaerophilus]